MDDNTISTPDNDDSPTQSPFDEAADAIFDEAFEGNEDAGEADEADEADEAGEASDTGDEEPPFDPDPDPDPEPDAAADDADDDSSLGFEGAVTALIAEGFTPEEVREMGNAAAMKIAGRLIAAKSVEGDEGKSSEPDTEGSSTTGEPEGVAGAAMSVLAKSNQGWSKAEQTDIANAIEAAIKAGGVSQMDDSVKASIKEMRDSFGEIMAVQHAKTNLSGIYPQLSKKGGMEQLIAKANELAAGGTKFKDLQTLTDAAALTLWGAERNETFKKNAKKASASKRRGSVTNRSKPVDNTGGDDFDRHFDVAYDKAGG